MQSKVTNDDQMDENVMELLQETKEEELEFDRFENKLEVYNQKVLETLLGQQSIIEERDQRIKMLERLLL